MNITLYKTSADNTALAKNPVALGTAKVITPTASIDVLTPSISIVYNSDFINCNYIYIPEFSRYYFASITVDTGGVMTITCVVDVMGTYGADLLSCPVNLIRAESTGATNIRDDAFPLSNDTYINAQYFPNVPFTPITDNAFTQNSKSILIGIVNAENYI